MPLKRVGKELPDDERSELVAALKEEPMVWFEAPNQRANYSWYRRRGVQQRMVKGLVLLRYNPELDRGRMTQNDDRGADG